MFIYFRRTNQQAELEVITARDENVTGALIHVIVEIQFLIEGEARIGYRRRRGAHEANLHRTVRLSQFPSWLFTALHSSILHCAQPI